VVGCPRSGTTWLSHLLASSGHFANYRAETHFYDLFVPRFGSPERRGARERLARAWLSSEYHRRTGVLASKILPELLTKGVTAGAFLEIIMRSTAEAQGVGNWSEATPGHALFMRQIADELPHAKFIHVIRDGRDVALSLARQNWTRSLPWDREYPSVVASWVWRRTVRAASSAGAELDDRYQEVRFEDLVGDLEGELGRIGDYLNVSLDLQRIERRGVGSATRPNTSFSNAPDFDPLDRWKTLCSPDELANLEAGVGDTLQALGYVLGAASGPTMPGLALRRRAFEMILDTKHFLKTRTRLGAFVDPESAAPPAGGASD
jgi:hypothetical protein